MKSSLPIIGQSSLPAPSKETSAGRQKQILAKAVILLGLTFFILSLFGQNPASGWLGLILVFGPIFFGSLALVFLVYGGRIPQIMNDGTMFNGLQNRGRAAVVLGVVITGFYALLYWKHEAIMGAAKVLNPLAKALHGGEADQWFLYGFMYTAAIMVMGLRMFFRYRHQPYHLWRTGSLVFFQLAFAFLIPAFLKRMNQPEFYFTYFWPLKPEYLFPSKIADITQSSGSVGIFMIAWGVIASFIATPILTYFYGKRWYCSWVCGCGGLAETLGDPWRHLSDKSVEAWRFERWSIHSVLVLIILVTALLWANSFMGGELLGDISLSASRWYGFFVGAVLSGVVGVGFYPLLGSRVWCRFFCPMAAVLGLWQRFFSRFRISTNGGQCISCGNCSTYCEMGIDVRAYAQRGENIVRASCVGCGVCASVCPRGVLKLENGSTHADRFEGAEHPLRALLASLRRR
jgi:ferredoxin-type protein NapH